jgi:hypothetical protein
MLRIHVCDDVIDSWKGVFKMPASLPLSSSSSSPWVVDIPRMGGYYDGYPRIQKWLLTSYTLIMSWGIDILLFDKQCSCMYSHSTCVTLVHCQQMIKTFRFIVNKCSPSFTSLKGVGGRWAMVRLNFSWFSLGSLTLPSESKLGSTNFQWSFNLGAWLYYPGVGMGRLIFIWF